MQKYFFDPEFSKENIASAGEKSIAAIYSGGKGDKLDTLRYQKYCEKFVKNVVYVETKIPPPTSSAATTGKVTLLSCSSSSANVVREYDAKSLRLGVERFR